MNIHEPPIYGIGVCLNCLHLFVSTPTSRNCLLCGRPPAITQMLQGPVPVQTEPAPAPPGSWGEGMGPEQPAAAPAEEEAGYTPMTVPGSWDIPCPCCGRGLVVEYDPGAGALSCFPAREFVGAEQSEGLAADVPAGEGSAPAEGGAAEPGEPVTSGEPSSEAAAAGVPVTDDVATPPTDTSPE